MRGSYNRNTRLDNAIRAEMDKALEARPPVITWRKNKHGILVAVSVRDPHAEYTAPARGRRRPEPVEPFLAEDIDYFDYVPECTDESLLNAARTPL